MKCFINKIYLNLAHKMFKKEIPCRCIIDQKFSQTFVCKCIHVFTPAQVILKILFSFEKK